MAIRSTRCERRSASAIGQVNAFTARAMTRPSTVSEISDCSGHRELRPVLHGHHVGRAERGARRDAEDEVVDVVRTPARRRQLRAQLVREREVGIRVVAAVASERPAAVELPVEEPEHERVARPHERTRRQDRCRRFRELAARDDVGEQDRIGHEHHPHQQQDQRDGERTEPPRAAGEVHRVGREQGDQQPDLDGRDEPRRAEMLALGLDHAQHDRQRDEAEQHEGERPPRFDRRLVGSSPTPRR